jgi:hypothetical protein
VVMPGVPMLVSQVMLTKNRLGFGAGLLIAALGLILSSLTADEPVGAPLRDLKLVRSYGVAAQIFDEVVDLAGLQKGAGVFLQTTIKGCREKAAAMGKSPQSIGSMGGSWLEYAMLLALKESKLTPAYWQAEFAAVPDNFNDVLLWSKEYGPVIISCKTSLRERYKQADLEAVALRQHFPNAKFFLLTLDEDKQHVQRIRRKIEEKEMLALATVYDETDADKLFSFLKTLTLTESPAKTLRSGKPMR